MIFGIDKDRVVRTRGHASFATNTNRFIEINDTVGAFEHRGCRTGGHTRCMRALIASRYLMRATHLRESAYIDVLDVRAGYRQRHQVFRLAGGCARVAADAARVVNDLGPFG